MCIRDSFSFIDFIFFLVVVFSRQRVIACVRCVTGVTGDGATGRTGPYRISLCDKAVSHIK